MKILRKSIVLTNKKSDMSRLSVLGLSKEKSGVFGNLKLYNIHDDNIILGIAINKKQVIKQNVIINSDNVFSFKLPNDTDLNSDMSAVLVSLVDHKVQPIVWGSDNKAFENKNNIIMSLNDLVSSSAKIYDINGKKQNITRVENFEKNKSNSSQFNNSITVGNSIDCSVKLIDDNFEDGNYDCIVNSEKKDNESVSKYEIKDNNAESESCAIKNECEINYCNGICDDSVGNDCHDELIEEKVCEDVTTIDNVLKVQDDEYDNIDENETKKTDRKNDKSEINEFKTFEAVVQKSSNISFDDDYFINLTDFASENKCSMAELEKTIFSNRQNTNKKEQKKSVDLDDESNKEKLFETSDEELEKIIDKGMSDNFYTMISEQLDELFLKFPRDYVIEKLIPNSKWVKVDFENTGKYYIIGVIYQEGMEKYVCFGVPSTYSSEPPRQLAEYAQWLPINLDNPYEKGYWIMYQDAITGDALSNVDPYVVNKD